MKHFVLGGIVEINFIRLEKTKTENRHSGAYYKRAHRSDRRLSPRESPSVEVAGKEHTRSVHRGPGCVMRSCLDYALLDLFFCKGYVLE